MTDKLSEPNCPLVLGGTSPVEPPRAAERLQEAAETSGPEHLDLSGAGRGFRMWSVQAGGRPVWRA